METYVHIKHIIAEEDKTNSFIIFVPHLCTKTAHRKTLQIQKRVVQKGRLKLPNANRDYTKGSRKNKEWRANEEKTIHAHNEVVPSQSIKSIKDRAFLMNMIKKEKHKSRS